VGEVAEAVIPETKVGPFDGKWGVWVVGPQYESRNEARNTLNSLGEAFIGNWVHLRGIEIEAKFKELWQQQAVLRANATDYAVWKETMTLEQEVASYWDCTVLWISDVYDQTDTKFWAKHILPWIDLRVQKRLPTGISGEVAPSFFGANWGAGFSHLFSILSAT
jgi:hypothetical protein